MSFPKSLFEMAEEAAPDPRSTPAQLDPASKKDGVPAVEYKQLESVSERPVDADACVEEACDYPDLEAYHNLRKIASTALHARNRAMKKADKLLKRLEAAEDAVSEDDEQWQEIGWQLRNMEEELGVPRNQSFFALPGIVNKTSNQYSGLHLESSSSDCNLWSSFTSGLIAGGMIVLSAGGIIWKLYQFCYPDTVVLLESNTLDVFPGKLRLQHIDQDTQTGPVQQMATKEEVPEESKVQADREVAEKIQDQEHMEAARAESKEMERDHQLITYSKEKFVEAVEQHLPRMVRAIMEEEIQAGRGDQSASSLQLDSSLQTEYREVTQYHEAGVPQHQSTPSNDELPPPPPEEQLRDSQDTVLYSHEWAGPHQGGDGLDSFSLNLPVLPRTLSRRYDPVESSQEVTFAQVGRKDRHSSKGE